MRRLLDAGVAYLFLEQRAPFGWRCTKCRDRLARRGQRLTAASCALVCAALAGELMVASTDCSPACALA